MLIYRLNSMLLCGIVLMWASCTHPAAQIAVPSETTGCKDANALNYDATATKADATLCKFATDSVVGIYDVQDTFLSYTSMGPVQTHGRKAIVVTRGADGKLAFSDEQQTSDCQCGINYTPGTRRFSYVNYSDPYTSSNMDGYFLGDTIYYRKWINSTMSSYTPSNRGRGAKR